MSLATVRPPARALLEAFETAASNAGEAEAALRKRMEAEILRLERERAYAYRRFNFMRLLSDGMQSAECGEDAVAQGRTAVRARLGWEDDSEARTEILDRLAPVMQAAFVCLSSADAEPPAGEAVKALHEFEVWYEARFERAFWLLFEQPVEELPLVER